MGSAASPFNNVRTALTNSFLHPGDEIVLREGVHPLTLATSLTVNNVTIRSYVGETAVIQLDGGSLNIYGDDCTLIALIIQGVLAARTSAQAGSNPTDILQRGVNIYGERVQFVLGIVYDTSNSGIGIWDAGGSILRGNLFLNNGWYSTPDGDYHGHGLYIQNDPGQAEVIVAENVFIPLNKGIKFGGTTLAGRENVTFRRNVVLHKEIYIHSGTPLRLTTIDENALYRSGVQIPAGSGTDVNDLTLTDNTIHSYLTGAIYLRSMRAAIMTGNTITTTAFVDFMTNDAIESIEAPRYAINDNAYYKGAFRITEGDVVYSFAEWQAASGQDADSTWSASEDFPDRAWVQPVTGYAGYGLVAVYNFVAQAATVDVDLTPLALTNGVEYLARQAQDPLNDTFTFEYDGSPVTFAMSGTQATPLGLNQPYANSFPDFGAWRIEPLTP